MVLKKLATFMLVVVLIMSLIGCNNNSANQDNQENEVVTDSEDAEVGDQEEEKITLRMAWWGSQKRHDITAGVIELYEQQNTNVEIEYEFYDFDGYITKLNTLVAADDVWDLFQLGGNFPTYLDKILPINDFIASGVIDTSNTTEAFMQTTRFEDIQLSLASGVNTYGIAYDPKMFADAG